MIIFVWQGRKCRFFFSIAVSNIIAETPSTKHTDNLNKLITRNEIEVVIKSVSIKKSPGSEGVTSKFYKREVLGRGPGLYGETLSGKKQ